MYCPNCGTEFKDGVNFCPKCGSKRPQPETTESKIEKPVNPAPISDIPTADVQLTDQSPNVISSAPKDVSKKKILYIGAIILICVKVALLYFILKFFFAGFETFIQTIDLLGITLFNPDAEEFTAYYAIIAAAEVILALLSKKFPTKILDKVFLLLPFVPTIKFLFIVVTNFSRFFNSLGLFYGVLSIAAVIIGAYYCLAVLVAAIPNSQKMEDEERKER